MVGLPLQHCQRTITDPDQFRDAVSGISLRVDFQHRQVRPSRVDQFQTPQWALDFGEANVRTRVSGVLEGGWASLCFVRGPGDSNWNSLPGRPGTIVVLPPGNELDGHTAANFSWITAAIPRELWERCQKVAGVDDDRPKCLTPCQLPASFLHEFESRMLALQTQLRSAANSSRLTQCSLWETAHLVETCFTAVCEEAVALPSLRISLRNRARLARRADAWLRGHLCDAIQVPDICLEMGVSRRELEYAFRSTYGVSPRDHLQALRLNAIRRALLKGNASRHTVITIAQDHGITHLGRFAKNYRELFGETPGKTLRLNIPQQ